LFFLFLLIHTIPAHAGAPAVLISGRYFSDAGWPEVSATVRQQCGAMIALDLKFPDGNVMSMACRGGRCDDQHPGTYHYYAVVVSNRSFLLKEDRFALRSTYSLHAREVTPAEIRCDFE
jgi:hypothetical protein